MLKSLSTNSLVRAERLWIAGHRTEARDAVQRARMQSRQTGDGDIEAQAILLLGEMSLADGDADGARARFVEARHLLLRTGTGHHRDHAFQGLGHAVDTVRRIEENRAHTAAAVAHYRQKGDLDGEARALMHLSQAERSRGKDDLAYEHAIRARRLFADRGDSLREAGALRLLAILHQERHEADRAHAALDQAGTLYHDHGDVLEEAGCLAELGTLLRGLGDHAEARRALLRAEQLFAASGDLEGQADVLMELALLEQDHDPFHARHHFEHAARLFAGCGLEALSQAARQAAERQGPPPVVH